MPWLQVKIASPKDTIETIEDALLVLGALAVTLEDNADQPILEPALGETPFWDHTQLTGLFDASVDTHFIDTALSRQFKTLQTRWEQVEDKDWEREWMSDYHPIRCGERLVIYPSWHTPEPSGNVESTGSSKTTHLLLDPGLAFGTGTHPTTLLCLQWLDQLDLQDKTIIDFGCGSGILAIAALLLGAKSAHCIDIDPQALLATTENAARNGIHQTQISTYLPAAIPNIQAEIVLANILAGPLVELAHQLSGLTAANGQLCLSGILGNQANKVMEHYSDQFTFTSPTLLDDWARLTAVKHQ